MGQPKNYLNGIFVKKKTGQYGEFFSIGIKKKEFIEQLQRLQEDGKGFVNLTMTPQRDDASKYSVYEDNWKPTSSANNAANTASNPRTPATNAMMADNQELPF